MNEKQLLIISLAEIHKLDNSQIVLLHTDEGQALCSLYLEHVV